MISICQIYCIYIADITILLHYIFIKMKKVLSYNLYNLRTIFVKYPSVMGCLTCVIFRKKIDEKRRNVKYVSQNKILPLPKQCLPYP